MKVDKYLLIIERRQRRDERLWEDLYHLYKEGILDKLYMTYYDQKEREEFIPVYIDENKPGFIDRKKTREMQEEHLRTIGHPEMSFDSLWILSDGKTPDRKISEVLGNMPELPSFFFLYRAQVKDNLNLDKLRRKYSNCTFTIYEVKVGGSTT